MHTDSLQYTMLQPSDDKDASSKHPVKQTMRRSGVDSTPCSHVDAAHRGARLGGLTQKHSAADCCGRLGGLIILGVARASSTDVSLPHVDLGWSEEYSRHLDTEKTASLSVCDWGRPPLSLLLMA